MTYWILKDSYRNERFRFVQVGDERPDEVDKWINDGFTVEKWIAYNALPDAHIETIEGSRE